LSQNPAVAGRKFMIFAVTAVILAELIAHDLWVLSRSAMSGDDLGGGPGRERPAGQAARAPRHVPLCLVWQAWRQLQQAGQMSPPPTSPCNA
jgi:hypothetical protein